mgnify:CR=1 FL=1
MSIERSKRRSYMIAGLLALALVGICARLYWIQLVSVRSFSPQQADLIARAEQQQRHEYVAISGRGAIVDRQGRSMTGEVNWYLVAFPMNKNQLRLYEPKLRQLAEITGYTFDSLVQTLESLQVPQALPTSEGQELILDEEVIAEIKKLNIPGIYAIQSDNRFALERDARQLIGRVARSAYLLRTKYAQDLEEGIYSPQSRIGITGLEAAFEPILRSQEEEIISYKVDGKGRPLNGLMVENEKKKRTSDKLIPPGRLVTTLDRDVQRIVEKVMDEEQVREGAVVVQEISSGDLLAAASRPKVGKVTEEENPWDHRALMETPPGSIFKTVVALAALDQGIVKATDTFHCNGELGRYGLKDSHSKGHGKQTFAQAYANSCNVVFGQVAEKLGGEVIEEYAKKLGFGRRIIWNESLKEGEPPFYQLPYEETGLIFAAETSRKDGGAVAQTGIGQRDVRVTPLQAVNMVTALFHNGKVPSPRLVQEVQTEEGEVLQRFAPKNISSTSFRPETLKSVQEMMRTAVTHGTARSLSDAKWPLAAKTGTAQLGLAKDRFNKWMIGYGPVGKPQYAVAVVVNAVPDSDDGRAHSIFKKVMDSLAERERS